MPWSPSKIISSEIWYDDRVITSYSIHYTKLYDFGQYILIPLLILYLVILYVYGGTIIYTWNWPKGIVTYLISCVSCIGIFTTLVVFPYAQNDGSPWLRNVITSYSIHYTKLYENLVLVTGDHETGYLTGPNYPEGDQTLDATTLINAFPVVNKGEGELPEHKFLSGGHTSLV